MNYIKYLLFSIVLALFGVELNAQTFKKFTEDPAIFITEQKSFFEDIDNPNLKKTAKEFIELFTTEWNSGKISDEKKKLIIATANKMLKKKMKPIPHFKNYFSAIINFNNTNQTQISYKAWEESLDKLINRPTSTQFVDFLEISNFLFTENILYQSSTTTWKSNNNNYYFEFDSIPRIIFPSLNLSCYANNDSSVIYNTKGVYYPTLGKWNGQEGKILWERAGFSEDSVYANLNTYDINVKYSKYSIDSVTFYNKIYFSEPLLGKLDEKILAHQDEDKATYPRFDSYDKRLYIKNIFPQIDYEGGFSMNGSKFLGSGNEDLDANLIFYREGKEFVRTGAKNYIIRKDRISSADASVKIIWEEDSIFHPGLQMKYLYEENELSLLRGKEGISKTPFFDTYHKLDIYVEALYWKLSDPMIHLKMIKGVGNSSEAMFESSNYYSEGRYYKLLGIDETHPLSDLRKFAKDRDTNVVYVPTYANYLRIALPQIQALMLKMANMGFISYDINRDKVTLKEKLENFLLSRAGKKDYDVIQIVSKTESESNATINLLNFDLKLNGVSSVYLSDSQNVNIFPNEGKMILKKNRDFDFDGRIRAGMFDFYGKLFAFSYEKFKVDMPAIDSMSFYVKSFKPDEKGVYKYVKVKSVIEGINGDLQIDKADNKSGLKSLSQYPLFTSYKDAYVYYDKKSIHNGVYNRKNFYFHINPFQIDSLDNITTEGIDFTGSLTSSDIFPEFNEALSVQPDYSLGFIRKTPASGFPVYKGKGIYDSIIDLSNKGLRGKGTLKYLTSVSKSDSYLFFPDSTNASVQLFTINEQKSGVEYPKVEGLDVYEHWEPYQEIMIIKKVKTPISMYDLASKLHGSLFLTPKELTGSGMMAFNDAEMDARLFHFKNRTFNSDTVDFRLKSYDLSELAFSTYNYQAFIDYDKRKGEFKSNGGGSKVEFPINMYICYMDEFDWYMDKDEIELLNSKSNTTTNQYDNLDMKEIADIDLSGSEFVSIHPDQDSLRFFSPKAKYNLKENIIYAKDVKIIKVADAAIYPEKGELTILKKAEMKPLENAKILTNTSTKYHTIYDAIVNIKSRTNYTASGKYDYIDESGQKFPFELSKVSVDTTFQSFGEGSIADSALFRISPEFDFTGKIKFLSNIEFLHFNGCFKINQDCDNTTASWIKFKDYVDPLNIYIPLSDTIRDINNNKLEAGIFLANDTNEIYTAFLSPKFKLSDFDLIKARGYIFYDKENKEYKVSNKEKIKQIKQPGNYLSYSKDDCISYGDGKIDLAPNLGRVSMKTYGNINHFIIPDSSTLETVIILNFFFNDNALKLMNENIDKYPTLKGLDLTKSTFTKTLTEIFGNKEADKYIAEISLNGSLKKIPTELQSTFVLSEVKMKWDFLNKQFVSDGKIGIVSIDKKQINKYVNGYITLKKQKAGDEINIYIEFSENDWYYFNYKTNIMQALSSIPEFNTAIRETKPDNRTVKAENDLPNYQYTISTETKKKAFLKKVETEEEN